MFLVTIGCKVSVFPFNIFEFLNDLISFKKFQTVFFMRVNPLLVVFILIYNFLYFDTIIVTEPNPYEEGLLEFIKFDFRESITKEPSPESYWDYMDVVVACVIAMAIVVMTLDPTRK